MTSHDGSLQLGLAGRGAFRWGAAQYRFLPAELSKLGYGPASAAS
ncbi:MAG TPA: hypothetical protein VF121_18840 [Thermoanaerobaculia bacterium]|nr:hypothetical protein [Thermoanaerobaculia bacterium]